MFAQVNNPDFDKDNLSPVADKAPKSSFPDMRSQGVLSNRMTFWSTQHPESGKDYFFVIPQRDERTVDNLILFNGSQLVLERRFSHVHDRYVVGLPHAVPRDLKPLSEGGNDQNTPEKFFLGDARTSAGLTTQTNKFWATDLGSHQLKIGENSRYMALPMVSAVDYLVSRQSDQAGARDLIDPRIFAALFLLEGKFPNRFHNSERNYKLPDESLGQAVSDTKEQSAKDLKRRLPEPKSDYIGFAEVQLLDEYLTLIPYACRLKNNNPDAVVSVSIVANAEGEHFLLAGKQWRPTAVPQPNSALGAPKLSPQVNSIVLAPLAGLLLDSENVPNSSQQSSIKVSDVLKGAQSEAQEEGGFVSDSQVFLGRFPTFGSECHYYVAQVGKIAGPGGGIPGQEHIDNILVPLDPEKTVAFIANEVAKGVQIEVPLLTALWFARHAVGLEKVTT